MLKRFFNRGTPRRAILPHLPDGQRVYAIGDIHGCDAQLANLLERIDTDDRARGGDPATLIFLGDLVDRGPDSAGVVTRLLDLAERRGDCRFLMGNHEEVFLKALSGDVKALRFFVRIGGVETLASYGIAGETYRDADFDELMALAQNNVPEAHLRFIQGFEDIIELGDYVFVHAGIRPDVALADQRPSDLRWIREEFLGADLRDSDKVVVHGHTISDSVPLGGNRLGVDTGAYTGGPLTAVGLEASDQWVLQS